MEAGATFFMTQPAFCDEDIEKNCHNKKKKQVQEFYVE